MKKPRPFNKLDSLDNRVGICEERLSMIENRLDKIDKLEIDKNEKRRFAAIPR